MTTQYQRYMYPVTALKCGIGAAPRRHRFARCVQTACIASQIPIGCEDDTTLDEQDRKFRNQAGRSEAGQGAECYSQIL